MRSMHFARTMVMMALLLGCGKQEETPEPPPPDIFVIDYAHNSTGVFFHGTLKMVGDAVSGRWTVDSGYSKRSVDVSMSETEFREIWDGVDDVPEFKPDATGDPYQIPNWKTNHVVGIAFTVDGRTEKRNFMVPVSRASKAFREWLDMLDRPRPQDGQ